MGWKYRRSGQGVDAGLAAHVAAELKNEAAIAKEARKAREEADHRRRNPSGPPQGRGERRQGGMKDGRASVGAAGFGMQNTAPTKLGKCGSAHSPIRNLAFRIRVFQVLGAWTGIETFFPSL